MVTRAKIRKSFSRLVYSTNTDSNDVSVIDLETKKEVARIPVGGSPRGPVEFDKTGTFGYVCNTAGDTISVIDLFTNREATRIKVGLSPRGLAISEDSRYAFVSNSGDNTLSVVDLNRRTKITDIAMGDNPRHMKVIPKRNALLVSIWGSDYVAMIDYSKGVETFGVMRAISVGKDARPYSISVDSKGKRAFVSNTQANYLSVIDIPTGQEIERIEVGFGGRASVLSNDEKFLFASIENSDECVVIELAKNKVIHRVKVGPSPRGITIDPKKQIAILSHFSRQETKNLSARNSLGVVDISNPRKAKYVGNIPVGLGPCSVSILTRSF